MKEIEHFNKFIRNNVFFRSMVHLGKDAFVNTFYCKIDQSKFGNKKYTIDDLYLIIEKKIKNLSYYDNEKLYKNESEDKTIITFNCKIMGSNDCFNQIDYYNFCYEIEKLVDDNCFYKELSFLKKDNFLKSLK